MKKLGKIKIGNFAGIKNVEIDLNRINIFLGPQASGKSVIVKLVYFFQSFIGSLEDLVKKNDEDFPVKYFEKRFRDFFPESFWTEEFAIWFLFDKFEITLKKSKKKKLQINFNKEFSDFLNKIKKIRKTWEEIFNSDKVKQIIEEFLKEKSKKYNNMLEELLTNKKIVESVESEIQTEFNKYYKEYVLSFNIPEEQIFIPAGRSYFSILKENIFSHYRSEVFKQIDPFLIEFGSFYEMVKRIVKKESFAPKIKDPTIDSSKIILKSNYLVDDEKEILRHSDGRDVELWIASSGQQEALPLLLSLKFFFLTKISGTLYIEEPEAHLFPFSQKEIVLLIAKLFNNNENLQFFITTHSPYILASFNNLMYAGFLSKKFSKDKSKLNNLYEIIPKENILNPNDVSAYFISEKLENLIDKKTHLIKASLLDSVSDNIANEFDKLLDLEY